MFLMRQLLSDDAYLLPILAFAEPSCKIFPHDFHPILLYFPNTGLPWFVFSELFVNTTYLEGNPYIGEDC